MTYPDKEKYGEWIYKELDSFKKYEVRCSICNEMYIGNYDQFCEPINFNYCPNCGANMNKTMFSETESEQDKMLYMIIERGKKYNVCSVMMEEDLKKINAWVPMIRCPVCGNYYSDISMENENRVNLCQFCGSKIPEIEIKMTNKDRENILRFLFITLEDHTEYLRFVANEIRE